MWVQRFLVLHSDKAKNKAPVGLSTCLMRACTCVFPARLAVDHLPVSRTAALMQRTVLSLSVAILLSSIGFPRDRLGQAAEYAQDLVVKAWA